MKAQVVVSTLLGLVSGTVAASDWQVVDHNTNAYIDEIDVSSLTRRGDIVRAWVRTVFSEPQVASGATFLSTRTRLYFNCAERRVAYKQLNVFADRKFEKFVFNGPSADDALLEWGDVAPDTVDEGRLEFACSKAPE